MPAWIFVIYVIQYKWLTNAMRQYVDSGFALRCIIITENEDVTYNDYI